jgi:creatinine amidohydrolase
MRLDNAFVALAIIALTLPSGVAAQDQQSRSRDMGGGSCRLNPYNCADAPNPLPATSTVWIEEMTWMDVRDAIRSGRTTVIIPTGGVEPNGPWLVTGKHNYVLQVNCDAIARRLGNAVCAPIVKFVPEGGIEPPTGHMRSPGTISLRQETFRAVLTDVVHSLKQHGFRHIILIGDSGGNQPGQRAVADSLTAIWKGDPVVAHVQEYYDYSGVARHMATRGIPIDSTRDEHLHDDPVITLNMFAADPRSVRYEERQRSGHAVINGISIADHDRNLALAREIIDFRAGTTADAIRKAIAHGGTLPAPPRQRTPER